MTDPTDPMNVMPEDEDPRPIEPAMPDLDDCCGSGCSPCVFDLYDEQREAWQQALRAWRQRQAQRDALSGRGEPPPAAS